MSFIEVDTIQRITPFRMLYIVTLTYIFKVIQFWKSYNIYTKKTLRASEKYLITIFIEVNTCHRTARLRILCNVTFTYIFKVTFLKMI